MAHTQLTSTQNPRIRALRELGHAKGRQDAGCFLVEGGKLVAEALRDARVETVVVDEKKLEAYTALLSGVSDVLVVPTHVLESVSDAKTPQGIVAAVRLPAPLDLDTAHGALLVLDGVQNPGNVGTMLRTAEAAGFTAALLSPACADAFAPKTVRGSMGSVLRVPIWRGELPEALALLQRKGFTLVSTELGAPPFAKAARRLRLPLALLIGSEGHGVSDAVRRMADASVSLPMRGRAESLNAAVAAGILMYGLMEGQA